MLNNLRRKRVQRIDIEEWQYYNIKSDAWWNGVVVGYRNINNTIGNQRYSKEKMEQSFDHNLGIASTRTYVSSMIRCPSGSFMKGHRQEDDNKPKEKKIPKAFLLGETEITQEIYQAVMGTNPSCFGNNPKHPVENVSWGDAVMFCNRLSDMFKLERYYNKITKNRVIIDSIEEEDYDVEPNKNSKGFRLPTEWEWEYAAKAGTQLLYSGSDNVDEVSWYKDNSSGTTHPVKQKKPNAWGFYDMSGNVWEWCETTYDSTYPLRVLRGGSWDANASNLRSTYRGNDSPIMYRDRFGFRVCRYI